jgi:hypothetical protein
MNRPISPYFIEGYRFRRDGGPLFGVVELLNPDKCSAYTNEYLRILIAKYSQVSATTRS